MAETSIQWATYTHNEWEGCQHVSPGCEHCYAEERNRRFSRGVNWGPGAPRRLTTLHNRNNPHRWHRLALEARRAALGAGRPAPERPRVFCGSLMDWCDADAPASALERLWATIRTCTALDWLMLTKRTARIAESLPADWGRGWPHVWMGTTVEDRRRAEERLPVLLSIPAVIRFVSYEPALELVDFRPWIPGIDWIIVGGESGAHARPFDLGWARAVVSQCRESGAKPFVKQLGAWPFRDFRDGELVPLQIRKHGAKIYPFVNLVDERHGGDMAEWPEDLRVRELPCSPRRATQLAASNVEPHMTETDAGGGELECPGCGDVAARGIVHDGQKLLCGCDGWISLDAESPPHVCMGDD